MSQHVRLGLLLTTDLLDALEGLCPARPPDPKDSEREIWMKAGERRLVEVLKAKYEEAAGEVLSSSTYG